MDNSETTPQKETSAKEKADKIMSWAEAIFIVINRVLGKIMAPIVDILLVLLHFAWGLAKGLVTFVWEILKAIFTPIYNFFRFLIKWWWVWAIICVVILLIYFILV